MSAPKSKPPIPLSSRRAADPDASPGAHPSPQSTITTTVLQLFTADAALGKLLSTPLPTLTSFHVGRVVAEIRRANTSASMAQMDVYKKYGIPVPGVQNQYIIQDPEKLAQANEELQPLYAQTVTLLAPPIPLSSLASLSILTPGDMLSLLPLLHDDSQTAPAPATIKK